MPTPQLEQRDAVTPVPSGRGRWAACARSLRPHQWSKNLLVFVPPLAAHRLTWDVLRPAAAAFAAFCLTASSAYVLNDLLDVEADRRHPVKRARPFAARRISTTAARATFAVAAALGFAVGAAAGSAFWAALAGYWIVTVAYSVRLKRVAVLDVIVLAGLYTLRILAGSLATGVPTSSWLFTLSMFFFLSLALVKRTSELRRLGSEGTPAAAGRGYTTRDADLLTVVGVASGLVAVLVLALYLSSPDVARFYAHHDRLWLLCPLALYWTSRVWLLASRGGVDEEPLLLAFRDRASRVTLALALVIVVAAV